MRKFMLTAAAVSAVDKLEQYPERKLAEYERADYAKYKPQAQREQVFPPKHAAHMPLFKPQHRIQAEFPLPAAYEEVVHIQHEEKREYAENHHAEGEHGLRGFPAGQIGKAVGKRAEILGGLALMGVGATILYEHLTM